MERFDALKRLDANLDPTKQFAIDQMKHLFTSAGLKDLESADQAPEISLKAIEAEIERLAGRYQELGFPKNKKISMANGVFKDSLMKLVNSQPENFRGRFDTPIIGFGQIPIQDQCKLVGIDYLMNGLSVRDWPSDPQSYKTPNGFYMTWTDEGARSMNRKVEDVRKELTDDSRGGTEFDSVGLYVAKPQVL